MMAMTMGDNEDEDSVANDSLAPRIQSFERGRIITRHGNGALVTYMVPLAWYSLTLEKCVQQRKWPKAVHLCRTVGRCEGSAKGDQGYLLWACLAGLSLGQQHIETAKTAYASLSLVDKVQFMNFLKEVPSDEGRAAELALFNVDWGSAGGAGHWQRGAPQGQLPLPAPGLQELP